MSQKKTPARKAPEKKAPARKAASRAPSGKKDGRPLPNSRRGPSSSDLLGLLVLALTASLAACAFGGDKKGGDEKTGQPGGQVTVRFLDVGQGDAVLVRSPEGKTLLYDGGRSTSKMQDYLQTYGVDHLDLMVASHADADHITGLIPAAEQAKPTLFINNGIAGTTQTWKRLADALEKAGTTFQKANNQVINLGSVKVRVIAPPAGMGSDQNDNSVGIRLDFGDFHALMTGDSETPETAAWLAENRADIHGPFQVYKSIHHGAANGDNQSWLAVVRPENVVISVGENNYGHPTQKALDLYKQNGIRIYRTDQQGTVTFMGSGDGKYTVTTDR
ncbi:ComEC/Rec2 family competence protein [Deinococcus metallilatus]|uniref:Beta-lactamase superfamily II metal-dependent hydrolase n=1 Tax=Deinococcus metallilatus TaxID=1211322 RepID=A0ABR6MW43_9DEIO|nr:ComEC/Rec2 family competence protein [Deinococcus metallilatus]MBB5296147.1 beta-lactamase superfamily II metal-dependent hydrolase [Deinococcus metallilatus]GMA14013.1 competence protein ComEC [Deinococcus metallilatus]